MMVTITVRSFASNLPKRYAFVWKLMQANNQKALNKNSYGTTIGKKK
jgi:hypothetical protein